MRSGSHHPVRIGSNVLIGAQSALYGCTVDDEAFLATGVTIFHGAQIGARAEIRIRGVVHVNSVLPPGAVVPIGWVAVGIPAVAFPPSAHEEIWAIQQTLDFHTIPTIDVISDRPFYELHCFNPTPIFLPDKGV